MLVACGNRSPQEQYSPDFAIDLTLTLSTGSMSVKTNIIFFIVVHVLQSTGSHYTLLFNSCIKNVLRQNNNA